MKLMKINYIIIILAAIGTHSQIQTMQQNINSAQLRAQVSEQCIEALKEAAFSKFLLAFSTADNENVRTDAALAFNAVHNAIEKFYSEKKHFDQEIEAQKENLRLKKASRASLKALIKASNEVFFTYSNVYGTTLQQNSI